MQGAFERTEIVFGAAAMERLAASHVAVFGLGGVGGHAAEALVRSGVGAVDLIDPDRFVESNLNRQLFATRSTLGLLKAEAALARCKDIAPDCRLKAFPVFFDETTASAFDFSSYDYVIDAIDFVRSKLLLIKCCEETGTPLISSMGTARKADPLKLTICDLYQTDTDPLAKVMRRECRKLGVKKLTVVCSKEEALAPMPGSTAFVPSVGGLLLASYVVRELIKPLKGDDCE